MSRAIRPHYGREASFLKILYDDSQNCTFATFAGTPTASVAGFAVGAICLDSTNSLAYLNTGTAASATWTVLAISGQTIAALTITALTATTGTIPTLTTTSVVGAATKTPVTIAAATTTLTLVPATHANRTILVQSTGGLAVTPVAATGTGDVYRFACIAAITGGSFTVDAKAGNASDVFTGWVQSYKATTFTPYVTASNSNLLTYNGTTTGGAAIGDWFQMEDIATNKWLVTGYTIQSGTIATMFSNH